MTFEIKVANKDVEVKFDYKTMFKANKLFGEKGEDGQDTSTGSINLFMRLSSGDDEGLIDFISLGMDKKSAEKLTQDKYIEAIQGKIDEYIEEGLSEKEAYQQIFKDAREEMLGSGFFVGKLEQTLDMMEKGVAMMDDSEDNQGQIKATERLVEMLKKEISSANASVTE